MIISCTKKVSEKLKKYRSFSNTSEEIGFHNWYCNLITIERKQNILFTNSLTLFSFYFPFGTSKIKSNIEAAFENKLKEEIIRHISCSESYLNAVIPRDSEYKFIHSTNKSVLGSMNEFKRQIDYCIWDRPYYYRSDERIIESINTCPMRGINLESPIRKMKDELQNRVNK